ncbi:MAG TPA: cytochrome c oxidase subunit II [Cryptosporangiaceae bacterium]|nr:cytochrome c oxidase subunit II [Cryptosporangiaceae bacterium]
MFARTSPAVPGGQFRGGQQVVGNPSAETGRRGRAARLVAWAGLPVVALSGCSTEEALRFGWPEAITPQGEQMLTLWTWSVVASLVVGCVVWGLMFWVMVAYRKRGEALPAQTRFNLPIEIVYTVVPFLIIAVLFYYTVVTQNYVGRETERPDVVVSVTAFKWNWKFGYSDVTGKPLQTTDGKAIETIGSTEVLPVLVVPTGKRIRFTEISNDVIHSFWVPATLFKRDVNPGLVNTFEITIQKEGSYVGRCAEFCGTYHANMNFELRAVSFADYQRFIERKTAGASTPDALAAIGQPPYATTTSPFRTDRTQQRSR